MYYKLTLDNDNKAVCDVCHFAKQKHLRYSLNTSHPVEREKCYFEVQRKNSGHGGEFFARMRRSNIDVAECDGREDGVSLTLKSMDPKGRATTML